MRFDQDIQSRQYAVPSCRNEAIYLRFLGAVQTRIEDCQKAFWSRFIGSGFTEDDIENVWPESNMRFFAMRYTGHWQSFQLRDLNLRELDALEKWLKSRIDKSSLETDRSPNFDGPRPYGPSDVEAA